MLNKEQDIFNVLFEAVSEGVIVVDDQQKIVSINSSIEKMFGYEKDELVHEKLNILIPKNYHSAYFLWANLSRFLNINMNIVACRTKAKFGSFFSKMHADYFVKINDLKN